MFKSPWTKPPIFTRSTYLNSKENRKPLTAIRAVMTVRSELQADNPNSLFQSWLKLAEQSELNDPTAAALATATLGGVPSVRMVLVKGYDAQGFTFYTNAESRKGGELMENPRAAMCFHWKSLRRQVRINGTVSEVSAQTADHYFHSRSRRSQIGAAVSRQSHPLQNREILEAEVASFAAQHESGEIPRPDFWRGFLLTPQTVEFWIDGADRLHDRLVFSRTENTSQVWSTTLLYP